MKEKFIKWEPIKNLGGKYYIESIEDNFDGLKIILSGPKENDNKVQILFDSNVLSYKSTDESFAQKLAVDLHDCYGKGFYGDWTFFKVLDSNYISFLSAQSYGWSDNLEPTHYCFICSEFVLDVISDDDPKVVKLI